MILRALLAAALLAGWPAWAQLPGADGGRARVTVDAAAAPWSSLVRVQAPGLARCTGFVLAPDRVVTAAHCLFSKRLGRFMPADALHVLAGYSAGGFAAHARVASYRVADGFDPRDGRGAGADVAVLVLAGPVAVPALPVATADGVAVMLGGYNQDRGEVIAADLACRLTGRVVDDGGRPLLAHDCAGTRGTSGAPLLQRGADGGWRVVGLQVAARVGAAGGFAVPAAAIGGLVE